ncbi:MAG: endonuclease/exonuclease/phosphatase family protein [Actinomycetota bacterium]|nr:endonuclease/exonuclease/phosphatase family protein [Actinomycetota bacterium]
MPPELEPFDVHPAQSDVLDDAADRLQDQARTCLDTEALTRWAHAPALAGWSGLASAELAAAPLPVRQGAVALGASLTWAGSCVRHWADVVRDFNLQVERIVADMNHELDGLGGENAPDDPFELIAEARDDVVAHARQLWYDAERSLDGGRSEVATLLQDGATGLNIRRLRAQGMLPETLLPVFAELPHTDDDQLRVLNLNAGSGFGNSPGNSDGTDFGDVDELAQRIAAGDVDVATLQEVFRGDLPGLERHLEELTGDEWDLHFVEASRKYRADDAAFGLGDTNSPFGNLVAVRRGDGVAYSEVVASEKLDTSGEHGDGSDGRAAINVRVHTANGATVDIVTAHTDPYEDGVVDETERARQIRELLEFAENSSDGPLVVTGDLNDTITGQRETNEAIREFYEEGYTDAASIGPTSDYGHGARIDLTFTSGEIGVSDPWRREGDSPDHEGEDHDLSDHDGTVVDISVPVPVGAQPPGEDEIPSPGDVDTSGDDRPRDDYHTPR